MKLVSWNVNGIRAVCRKGFPDIARDLGADILCLQETKADADTWPAEANLDGYRVAMDFGVRKGYSGTATLSRVPPLAVARGLGAPGFDDEGRAVVMEFPDFVLYNIYFPNGGASPERLAFKLAYYEAFLARVDAHHAAGQSVIVVGDVNTAHREIDLARPKENAKVSGFLPEERAWVDRFLDHGLVDTFRALHPETVQYSWWDMKTRARERNAGWRIDYVLVSAALAPRVREAFILGDVLGSDHCPVGVVLA